MNEIEPGAEKTPEKRPWEQMEGEGSRAYEVFLAYLELGAFRSVRKVYNDMYRVAKGKEPIAKAPPGFIRDWSLAYTWKVRADLWDKHRREVKLAGWEEKKFEARDLIITDFLKPLLLTALSNALGFDARIYQEEEGRIENIEPLKPQQLRTLRDLLDRAGLEPVHRAEVTHHTPNRDPFAEFKHYVRKMKHGTESVAPVDARELARMYFEAIGNGGEDQ